MICDTSLLRGLNASFSVVKVQQFKFKAVKLELTISIPNYLTNKTLLTVSEHLIKGHSKTWNGSFEANFDSQSLFLSH